MIVFGRIVKYGLTFGVASSFFLLSYNAHTDMRQVEMQIRQQPAYMEVVRLDYLTENLKSARSKLDYKRQMTSCIGSGSWGSGLCVTHPASHPDPRDARTIIYSVSPQLGDLRDIGDRLTYIHDSLPDQNDIKEYNGRRVDDSIFRTERELIDEVIGDISSIRGSYMKKVPQHLKSKKDDNKYLFIISLLGGIANLAVGLSTYLKRGESR